MAFIKNGDAQPIVNTYEGVLKNTDEETKKALEAAKQAVEEANEDDNVNSQDVK